MTLRNALIATFGVLFLSVPALAQDAPPNVTGVWSGTFTGGVRGGGGQLAAADEAPRFVQPGDRDITLTIDEQDGRGFVGRIASNLGSEAVQGVIRLDNRTLLMVDDDSTQTATLLSDGEMEFCNHSRTVYDRFTMCFLLMRE
ncbi:hypothetical protein [Bauldia sp.]|uniref:hypothetical protein n=1 Tax=Bauldia sp. TaxID=2575872 RepID=UPI003BAD3E64